MKKKHHPTLKLLFVLFVVAIVVFFFPSGQKKISSEQKEELSQYVEKINVLNAQRTTILNEFNASVVQAEQTTLAYRTLEEDILPPFAAYQQEVEKIKPHDAGIARVHMHYLNGTNTQLESFQAYVKAYREQQETLYVRANKQREESNTHYGQFDRALRDLAKTYSVDLTN